jgi:hypothetical protein
MMSDLEEILGEAITAKELAEYLGVNETSIRKNFQQYGGIRVGRHYRFFTKEVINAIQKQTEEQVHSSGSAGRETGRKSLPDTQGCKKMGSRNEKNVGRRLERGNDRHGLLD